MKPKVEIRCGRGEVRSYDIGTPEVTVGSSVDATISLDKPDELDPKHILLVPRGRSGCWVSVVKGARTPVEFTDATLTDAVVPWGSELRVGSISVRPCLGDPSVPVVRLWQTGLLVVALGAVVAGVITLAREDANARMDSGSARAHPQLFVVQPRCPTGERALESGARAEQMARSRADRYPYDPRDGVRGVQSYRVAASCYEAAGQPLDARRTRVAADRFAHRIGADYAAARLDLAHAIESERWVDVLRESRHLQLLTSHLGEHDYVEWLEEIVGKATARRQGSP